jgi:hypothetical protein
MPQYEARFRKGSYVTVVDAATLREFAATWRLHHPLTDAMLAHAGERRRVLDADFYFGGDPIYRLEGLEGYWHEPCLEPADVAT